METCPHGARITVVVDEPVTFIDDCGTCQNLLADLGFESSVTHRETVTAA